MELIHCTLNKYYRKSKHMLIITISSGTQLQKRQAGQTSSKQKHLKNEQGTSG